MINLQAFYGKPEIKERLCSQLEEDYQQGRIVQGDYWNGECGCLIGCATRDRSHALYTKLYNVPVQLAYLFDRIFENLPLGEAQQFTLDVHKIIAVGADLSLVLPHFLVWLLEDKQDGVIRFADMRGKKAIAQVATLYKRKIAGETISKEEWRTAYADAAAAAATYTTDAAATAAATAADAAAAAATYTTDAAATAAATAADAAAAAARKAHLQKMRDKLLILLAEAPVQVESEV